MNPTGRHRWARDANGSATVEFALVSLFLMTMILAVLELGLMMWVRGTVQAIAAQTARCAAIGAAACTTQPNTPSSYAVGLATAQLGSGIANSLTVTPTAIATRCFNATGTFEVVTITVTPWIGPVGAIMSNLGPSTKTLTACYPHT